MATNHGLERKAANNLIEDADEAFAGRNPRSDASVPGTDLETTTPPISDVAWKRSALVEAGRSGKRPRSPGRWIQILALPLLALLGLAVWLNVVRIQDNLEAAADQILTDSGIETGSLAFDANFRDIEVSGVLPPGVTADQVELILETESGANGEDIRRAIVNATPAFGPIDVAVAATGNSITLSGSVPGQADLDRITAAADRSGASVTTNMTVLGTEPESDDHDELIESLELVLPLLGSSIEVASLSIDNDTMSGTIEASDSATRDALLQLSELDNVSIDAFGELNAEVTFDGSRVVLNGNVLTEDQASILVDAATSAVGGVRVVNNLAVLDVNEAVAGADSKVGAVARVLRSFDNLNFADARFTDTNLTLNGEAPDPIARQVIDETLEFAVTSGLQVGGIISTEFDFTLQAEIDRLQVELDTLQEELRENVRFEADTDRLIESAPATLDRVVEAMNRYTRPVVEIVGHTDSRGSERANLQLSLDRAIAVAAYIEDAGIDASRLNTTGLGESRAIADNLTEAGRRENRRVEFTARESF